MFRGLKIEQDESFSEHLNRYAVIYLNMQQFLIEKVNTRSFKNDMRTFETKDDVLTQLVHLGYLAYDSGNREAFIPNKEIVEEFENAMGVGG